MLAFLLSVIGVLVVGGLLFLAGSLLLGRGETQPPAELDRSPMELPDDRPVVGDDIRALRISPAVRGYRMTEVDWLLDQFAQVLDERDRDIAELRARLAAAQEADRREPEPAGRPADTGAGAHAGSSEIPPDGHPSDGHPSDGHPSDGDPSDGDLPDGERADGSPAQGEDPGGEPPGGAASGGGPAGYGARLHA